MTPPWFYGSPGLIAGAVCPGSAPATPQPHSLTPSLFLNFPFPWSDPKPCVTPGNYPYPGYFLHPDSECGLGHGQGPAEGATMAAGAGTPLQLCKSSTLILLGNFRQQWRVLRKGRECVCRQWWVSTVRARWSFHPSSVLNVGRLQGINCARSLYPLHRVFTPRHSLEEPMSWPYNQAGGAGPGCPPHLHVVLPAMSPAGRSAVMLPFQDWSLCQYWTPLKWFLGTSNYGHLNMNILQSMTFASQGQHIALLHCKINDPCI